MNNMISHERRSYVRGEFPFKVRYTLLTPDEYQKLTETINHIPYTEERIGSEIADKNTQDAEMSFNPYLIDFLLKIDEKLDLILSRLSPEDTETIYLAKQGMGTNISGSGMNMVISEPAQPGQIIHARFVLSKAPLVYLDLFGEILWVTPSADDDGKAFNLGIEFLDLKPADQERIIACVFQRQRKSLRQRKKKESISHPL
ncbi:MAG: PilZ domain-containing protein [Deltaproteobacteria bacterium]|nr:MAG: PilZ domain-containing protein [Deltaproteobacteria bacterium]